MKLEAVSVPPVPASRLQGFAPALTTVPIVRLPSSGTDAPGGTSRTNPAEFPAPEGTTPPCQFEGVPQLPPAAADGSQKALWPRAAGAPTPTRMRSASPARAGAGAGAGANGRM